MEWLLADDVSAADAFFDVCQRETKCQHLSHWKYFFRRFAARAMGTHPARAILVRMERMF